MDNFFLRFNLEKCGNSACTNPIKAVSYLYDQDEDVLETCADYYKELVRTEAQKLYNNVPREKKESLKNKSIVFFGDSLTSDRLGYANIIAKTGLFKTVDNFAVSGIISSEMVREMKKRSLKKYDYVSVFIGTNDSYITNGFLCVSVGEFERCIRFSADEIKAAGVKGIMISLPRHPERTDCATNNRFDEYNAVIGNICKEYGFDLIVSEETTPSFIEDNIHLDFNTQIKLAYKFIESL